MKEKRKVRLGCGSQASQGVCVCVCVIHSGQARICSGKKWHNLQQSGRDAIRPHGTKEQKVHKIRKVSAEREDGNIEKMRVWSCHSEQENKEIFIESQRFTVGFSSKHYAAVDVANFLRCTSSVLFACKKSLRTGSNLNSFPRRSTAPTMSSIPA